MRYQTRQQAAWQRNVEIATRTAIAQQHRNALIADLERSINPPPPPAPEPHEPEIIYVPEDEQGNEQLPALAVELVQHQVSVIVVLESTNGALAAKAATKTIPIVFMQGADPVGIGLVDSLNRPGGNLTGIGLLAAETAGKCFDLLLEVVPKARSIAYLRNPTNPAFAESETRELQTAARAG